jgi:hypothetical protein
MRSRRTAARRKSRRVPDRELKRRIALAVEEVHATAARAIGTDVDSMRLRSGLMWVFAYLLGGELAHLTYVSKDHQEVETRANRALACGIGAYANCLRTEGPAEDAWVADFLIDLANRISGARRQGRPDLGLVRDLAPPAPVDDVSDDVIPF